MGSLDDMVRERQEQQANQQNLEQARESRAREQLSQMIANLEGSITDALANTPDIKDPSFNHRKPDRYQHSQLETIVECAAHTELVDLNLGVRLGWIISDDDLSLGRGEVGKMRVSAKDRHDATYPEKTGSVEYQFSKEVVLTPACAVDPLTLRLRIEEAVKAMLDQRYVP